MANSNGNHEVPTDSNNSRNPLFRDLAADEEQEVSEIESLCLNCYKQGITKLLLTRIPFFKEVIISSFVCEECGYTDRSTQMAGQIQEKGIAYKLSVTKSSDLDRQVVKSEFATFKLPELDFEQQPRKKGEINTIEGLIVAVIDGLKSEQKQRWEQDADTAAKIDAFIQRLEECRSLQQPFTVIVDDPSGNSFVENPLAPQKDEALSISHYTRTVEQDIFVGVRGETEETEEDAEPTNSASDAAPANLAEEVLTFGTNCPNCLSPCEANMKMVDIPFFKQVIIMATVCEMCGHRDNEVKGGTSINEQGCLINLHLTEPSDLSRDILKSNTCGLKIPELELEMEEGSLGGRFTTVEGLLTEIRDQLSTRNPFFVGDSQGDSQKQRMAEFISRLDGVISGQELNVHLILDDPAGNSYIQNVYAPEPDPEMEITNYTRSFEQNEMLGLNDMKTEDYTADDATDSRHKDHQMGAITEADEADQ